MHMQVTSACGIAYLLKGVAGLHGKRQAVYDQNINGLNLTCAVLGDAAAYLLCTCRKPAAMDCALLPNSMGPSFPR